VRSVKFYQFQSQLTSQLL